MPGATLKDPPVKAIVFDIDGTLYRQDRLRLAVLVELARRHVLHPIRGRRTALVLRAYRRAQEQLRAAGVDRGVASAQVRLTCERTRVAPEEVVDCVRHWMEEVPLAFLPRCIQPGLLEFLQTMKARGIRTAALSDYPGRDKLEALGVAALFDAVLAAQDPEIDAFKPNPRGLAVALERLGAAASDCLYVGDRGDVDAPTARAAGVRCVIVSSRRPTEAGADGAVWVAGFPELGRLLQ